MLDHLEIQVIGKALNVNNTKTMYNYLTQQIIFCLNLEESLFSSFMEEMRKKLHRLV